MKTAGCVARNTAPLNIWGYQRNAELAGAKPIAEWSPCPMACEMVEASQHRAHASGMDKPPPPSWRVTRNS
eukprot:4871110-Lingulodinium_polyedra.AAC.1